MRKVLIISPHFPPINAPDHQRVRMALPYFEQFGWKPTVLAVRADCDEGVQDPLLEQSLPPEIRVVRTGAWSVQWTRKLGFGGLAYRAGWKFRRAGDDLLSREPFDLLFFSTTMFPLMPLGRRWSRRFGVPYVLDFQDPWVSDYYERHPDQRPPGGRLKYAFAQWLARRTEGVTVRNAAHSICVSPAYPKMFHARYPDLPETFFSTLPFGAAELDFELVRREDVRQTCFDPADGKQHWVYAGVVIEAMLGTVRAFLRALRDAVDCQPELSNRLRVHFIGTDYVSGPRARKIVEPCAWEFGVGGLIEEIPQRVPYFEALRTLCDAHALIAFGSDDPGYTASKLYPYILARKPLLAVFHEQSSVVDILRRTGAGTVVTFDERHDLNTVSEELFEKWFARWPVSAPATDWDAFAPYTAREMTRRLCEVFDRAVATESS